MDKMTFREAQLCVLGTKRCKGERVIPVNMEIIPIGDTAEIIEICLDKPFVVVRLGGPGGPESYCNIDNFSEKVIDQCVELLRDIAMVEDSGDQRRN